MRNLLNQVFLLTKKNSEIFEKTGGRFNLFGILGVDHYEITHSSIIKEFLDPKGSHGLKSKFLNAFIETVVENCPKSSQLNEFKKEFDLDTATVQTEFVTPDGRYDILIQDNQGHVIIIENKIHAKDQWKQLVRYNNYAASKWHEGNYILLYLSLLGSNPDKESAKNVNYFQISHAKDIISWLEKCVEIASRFPLVRETLIQYINHLNKLTNQDMNSINSKEIVELLTSSRENINAAITIHKNYNAICTEIIKNIIEDVLKPQMDQFASENNLKLYRINGSENYVNIEFEKSNWMKCRMLINTEGTNLYGFRYNDNHIKIEDSKIDILKNHFPKAKSSDWWPIWERTDNYKNISIDVWLNEIKNRIFGDYVINLFKGLLNHTYDMDL